MRHTWIVLLFCVMAVPTSELSAQQPPHMDLVRGLRSQGMPDLALEYLDKIAALKLPEITRLLPVEYARTRLELASQESEESKRAALIAQAKGEFEGFLRANAADPLASSVKVELARLVTLQGRSQLTRARKAENKTQNRVELQKAQPFFLEAAKAYADSIKLIDAQLKKIAEDTSPATNTLRKDLVQTRFQARLDQAITLFDLGQTFVDDVIKRGEKITAAKKLFNEMAFEDDTQPLCWVARAWVSECDAELDNNQAEARKNLETLATAVRNPAAAVGARTARAFLVKYSFADIGSKGFEQYRVRAEAWIRDYGAFRNTPEGLLVRYSLAKAYQNEGMKLAVDKSGKFNPTPTALAFLRSSEAIYKDISENENEYSDRSARNRMTLILQRIDLVNKGKDPEPESLKTFEECWLQAQVQLARFQDFISKLSNPAESLKALKDEELRRYSNVVRLIEQGLTLVKPTDSPTDVYNARVQLAAAYSTLKRPGHAAIMGEYLAKAFPKGRFAGQMGSLAMSSYITSLNTISKAEGVTEFDKAADVLRIKQLAQYMEEKFPTDPETDSIRHTMGYLLRVEKKNPEALEVYRRITPAYSHLSAARQEQGGTLFSIIRPEGVTDPSAVSAKVAENIKANQAAWDQTLAALATLPEPPATGESVDVDAWFKAKNVYGRLLQLEGKKFDQVQKLGEELIAALPKFTGFDPKLKAEQLYSVQSLRFAGLYGVAFEEMKTANYAKVAELLDPVIIEIQKSQEGEKPAELPLSYEAYRDSQRRILVLAMRAAVQDAKIDRATELLASLQKSDKSPENTFTVLRQLVGAIRVQIDTLKKESKPDEAKKLTESFVQFLQNIAKQDKLPNSMLRFLAQGYAGIDQHTEAVKLLEKITANTPKLTPPGAKATEEEIKKHNDEKEAQDKFMLQVDFLTAKEYRLAGEYKKADTLLHRLIGDTKKKGPLFSSVEARKESFYLLEDQKKWTDAVKGWTAYAGIWAKDLPPFPPKNAKQASHRALYFDLYFEAQRSSAKAYSSFLTDAKNKEKAEEGLGRVAQKFVDLEKGNTDLTEELRERIGDFIDSIPFLKAKYLAAGGKLVSPTSKK